MLNDEELYEIQGLTQDEVLCSEKYCPFIKEAMKSEDDSELCNGEYCEQAYRKYKEMNFEEEEEC